MNRYLKVGKGGVLGSRWLCTRTSSASSLACSDFMQKLVPDDFVQFVDSIVFVGLSRDGYEVRYELAHLCLLLAFDGVKVKLYNITKCSIVIQSSIHAQKPYSDDIL